MVKSKTKILILGAGFGGIKTALEIEDTGLFDITLVSDDENFRYYPALYRAATGGKMAAANIPLNEIFKDKQVQIIKDDVKTMDKNAKKVKGSKGSYDYDKVVLALGVITNYFGIKGLKEYSYGIKTKEEAKELRDHIHKLLVDKGKPDANYIVIGGGPTGVELAGSLSAYIKHIMRRHGLKDTRLHIDLVEAAPRLMPRMPKSYSKAIAKRLRHLGVKLYLNQTVQAETVDSLVVSGHSMESHTVAWTAGVTNHPFFATNKFNMTDHGKVKVDDFLRSDKDVYVIGDNADTPFSGMAQSALHNAKFVAGHLEQEEKGEEPKPYKPKKPIYVTPVGGKWAAVLWNNIHIYGWFAWFLRSAADYVGYHDYEPWWLAGKHWIAEYEAEDSCPVCAGK
jgi:NADH dehydrogenase